MPTYTQKESCFAFLSRFLREYIWTILVSFFVFTVLSDFIEFIGGNYLLKIILDRAGESGIGRRTIVVFLAAYPTMVSISFLASAFRRKIIFSLLCELKEKIRSFLFCDLLKQSNSFFNENFSGTLNSKINDIVGNITYFIENSFDLFSNLLTLFALVVIFFTKNVYLGLILVLFTVLYLFIFYFLSRKLEKRSEITAAAESTCSGKIIDCFANILNVKSFSKEKLEKNNIRRQTIVILRARSEQQCVKMINDLFNFTAMSILVASISLIGFSLYTKKIIGMGDLVFVIQTTTSIFWWLRWAMQRFTENVELFGEMNQAVKTLLVSCDIVDSENAKSVSFEKGKIEFRNVYFKYAEDKPYVFENLNLTIEANQKVGVVGYSGAGKSSLISLLMRIYDLSGGNIYVDGYDIKTDVSQDSLRKNISYIPQEPILFHRTIEENIAYGKTNATHEEIVEASVKSNCYEFIARLDRGFNSMVGERGLKLSGGQRQRIVIAMVVLKNSKILIMDEATSSLDSLTEKEIQDTIGKLMIDKTVIVIAHRLSTLNYVDRIVVFDRGKIVEDGPKDKLLANENGLFRRMWNMQKSGISDSIDC
ncbi:MAG: ABC transporter ATP-binding protein/permease [Rickettsiales bacterium]|nr:ABC transporter ATP-binding protein/permease [Rickettsiales bacterium]